MKLARVNDFSPTMRRALRPTLHPLARLALLLAVLLPLGGAATPGSLPRLVFVSRQPLPHASSGVIPGLGPHHRIAAPGGRLMVRERGGRVHPLLEDGAFFDASDPSVSWDGKRIAFAAVSSPDSAWRIWVVNADGSGLTQWTRTDHVSRAPFRRYDDIDPCWLPDGRICFATTRYPQIAQRGGVQTTNLYVVQHPDSALLRVTSERNGAEEPTIDLETGRVVFARWWFNRYLASERDPSGVTVASAQAVPGDSVNIWHAISMTPDGDGGRLAGGFPRVRAETMAYQPIVLRDGTVIGVQAENLGLSPAPGRTRVYAFPRRFSEPVSLAGGGTASACAPAVLPDGRILLSLDRAGTGDFALAVVRADGAGLAPVLDLPLTAELDAAVLEARRTPTAIERFNMDNPRTRPLTDLAELRDDINATFRFDCMNVFGTGPVDSPFPDAPPADTGVRIRFYATLARPRAPAGDTVVLYRESAVQTTGGVHEDQMPADTPMFEQLIDAHGHVLRSPMGPAHVSGLNSGRFGAGTKCQGCHIGHSALAVPTNYSIAQTFNLSPSAEVTASSAADSSAGVRGVVDRRVRGPSMRFAWVANAAADQKVRLAWRWPIAADTLVLYAPYPDSHEGTDLRVRECRVELFRGGRSVRVLTLKTPLSHRGTPVPCEGVTIDALEVRPTRMTGRVAGKDVAALAEIETMGRLIEE